jgi:DNA-binding transcriptional regulator YiaG
MTPAEFTALRHKIGMSREQLAAALGVSLATVKNYASGRVPIPGPVTIALDHLAHCRRV